MQLEAQLVHAEPGNRVVLVRALAKDQCLGSALGEAPTAEEAEDRASTRLLARLATQPEPSPQPPTKSQSQAPSPKPDQVHRPAVIPTAIPSQAPGPEPTTEPVPAPAAAPNDSEPKLPPFQKLEPPSEEQEGEPEDWSSELAGLDLQLQRLGWTRDEEGIYLERAFSHPSRNRLTSYVDLVAYLRALEALSPGANPGNAPVPLRRKDLLSQCDQLLGQLQWDASRGRSFLEKHFNLSSRQQLNDTQLLQFNMLLEGELMGV
jgi:hypothetical protein|uniref:hypothetical protein n=1 Tax=Cyanobium sp. TaxID=2164130 RepID=UPI0040476B37